MKRRRRPSNWTPFKRATAVENPDWPKAVRDMLVGDDDKIWLNNRYQVSEREDISGLTHLSIKRIDRLPIHDWRDLQRIKNEICGPEREAVELYPAESRLVDTANQYHLYVLPAGVRAQFGFTSRLVTDQPGIAGAVQRPFDDPPATLEADRAHAAQVDRAARAK